MFHKVNNVSALPNYELSVHFWDGTTKIYDVKPLFKKWPIFATLKGEAGDFNDVKVDEGGYGISWNDKIDLSCNELWENGQTIQTDFDKVISFADASNAWGLSESTLRKAVAYGKLKSGIDVCKYGKQWLISINSMREKYGDPKLAPHNLV